MPQVTAAEYKFLQALKRGGTATIKSRPDTGNEKTVESNHSIYMTAGNRNQRYANPAEKRGAERRDASIPKPRPRTKKPKRAATKANPLDRFTSTPSLLSD